jgi:hypothetical protein
MVAFVKKHNQNKFYRANFNLIFFLKKKIEPNQSIEIWGEKLITHSTKYHMDFKWNINIVYPSRGCFLRAMDRNTTTQHHLLSFSLHKKKKRKKKKKRRRRRRSKTKEEEEFSISHCPPKI